MFMSFYNDDTMLVARCLWAFNYIHNSILVYILVIA